MKLPKRESALVERAKIVDYLLNENHPRGAPKAWFFTSKGYSAGKWKELAIALAEHALANEVAAVRETGFGPRYIVEGDMVMLDGSTACVRTVWQFDFGSLAPRLITAYPLER